MANDANQTTTRVTGSTRAHALRQAAKLAPRASISVNPALDSRRLGLEARLGCCLGFWILAALVLARFRALDLGLFQPWSWVFARLGLGSWVVAVLVLLLV